MILDAGSLPCLRVGDELIALAPGGDRLLLFDLRGRLVYDGLLTDSREQVAEALQYAAERAAERARLREERAAERARLRGHWFVEQAEEKLLRQKQLRLARLVRGQCAGYHGSGFQEFSLAVDLDLDLVEERAAVLYEESRFV